MKASMNPFTRTQLADLTRAIGARDLQLRDEIRDALMQAGEQKYIDLAGQVHDQADESVANELIEVENALTERHVRELREIGLARERLARGKINDCIECGGEIGFKRLLANPVAVRCVDCQGRLEKTHVHEGTPRL
jgi:RNA polymerase-binding transcription factor DksA